MTGAGSNDLAWIRDDLSSGSMRVMAEKESKLEVTDGRA
jgi:hypothetical protein